VLLSSLSWLEAGHGVMGFGQRVLNRLCDLAERRGHCPCWSCGSRCSPSLWYNGMRRVVGNAIGRFGDVVVGFAVGARSQ
jgi:hypothetical protein